MRGALSILGKRIALKSKHGTFISKLIAKMGGRGARGSGRTCGQDFDESLLSSVSDAAQVRHSAATSSFGSDSVDHLTSPNTTRHPARPILW